MTTESMTASTTLGERNRLRVAYALAAGFSGSTPWAWGWRTWAASAKDRARKVLPALVGIVILSLVATAAAESGTFRLIRSYQHNYTTFEFADQTITGGALEGTATILESSGDPFVAGENSRVTCMIYSKRSEAGLELEGPCVMTFSGGEKLFTLSKRTLGSIGGAGQGGAGRMQLLGGTGKFVGVTGSCSYETEYLEDDWLVTVGECEWERP